MTITWHKIGKGKKIHACLHGNIYMYHALCGQGPVEKAMELIFPSDKCYNCIREVVKLKEREKLGLESWCEGHPESPDSNLIGGYSRRIKP